MSNLEILLNALINGEDVTDFEPQSRCEAILKACCTGEVCGVEPQSRIEALLKVLHGKMCEGGGDGSAEEEWFNDGNTHIWISLPEGRTSPMVGVAVEGTATVDWGDGTEPTVLTGKDTLSTVYTPHHHYASAGDYVITVTGKIGLGDITANDANAQTPLLRESVERSERNIVYQAAIRRVEIGDGVDLNLYALACQSGSFSVKLSDTVMSSTAFCYCFDGAIGMTSIIVSSDNVFCAYDAMWSKCKALANIIITDNVTMMGMKSFEGCSSLGKIRFEGTTPPIVYSSKVFLGVPADCIFSVPVGCLEAYTTATNYPDPNTYTYVEE